MSSSAPERQGFALFLPPCLWSQVWHLLASRVGLCGELTALLAAMAAFHGITSQPMKLCFVDRNAEALASAAAVEAERPAEGAMPLPPWPSAACDTRCPTGMAESAKGTAGYEQATPVTYPYPHRGAS